MRRVPTAARIQEASAFFDGPRLTLARHLAGLRKSDLAARISKSATAVASWESGAKNPSPPTVSKLSLALSVDPEFFSIRPKDVAAASSTPHFRSLRSTTQLARDQAVAYGHLAVDVTTGLERHVEFPDPSVPSFPVSVESTEGHGPEIAAQKLREEWNLGRGPIGHIIRLLESHGVLVVFSPHQAATVDAYSFDSRLRPVVVLNPLKRDYYRQRFDLAHELGHLVMHSDAEPGGRIVEDQAHRFAAEFLMPSNEVIGLLPATMNGAWPTLRRLKEDWGVSMQAVLYHARRMGRISDVSYRNAMATLSSKGWRREEPGLVKAVEQPSLLPRALELLEHEGISESILLDECRVPAGLFRVLTARIPADPSDHPNASTLNPTVQGKVISLLSRRDLTLDWNDPDVEIHEIMVDPGS